MSCVLELRCEMTLLRDDTNGEYTALCLSDQNDDLVSFFSVGNYLSDDEDVMIAITLGVFNNLIFDTEYCCTPKDISNIAKSTNLSVIDYRKYEFNLPIAISNNHVYTSHRKLFDAFFDEKEIFQVIKKYVPYLSLMDLINIKRGKTEELIRSMSSHSEFYTSLSDYERMLIASISNRNGIK